MRVAVVSDIHSNLHALEAVLDGSRARICPMRSGASATSSATGRDRTNAATSSQERATVCLAGNHDLGVRGDVDIDDFSFDAAAAALWTRDVLGERAWAFLRGLVPLAEADGVQMFHASPRDPVWEYVLTDQAAAAALELTSALDRARRAQSCLAGGDDGRRRARRRPRSGRHGARARGRAAGSSTPDRSASRATATRVRPGSCSTSTHAARRSGGSSTRSPRRSWRSG